MHHLVLIWIYHCQQQQRRVNNRLYTEKFHNTGSQDAQEISRLDLFTVGSKFTRPACRARQQQPSIDICCGRAPDLSSKPAGRAAIDRRDRQTDGRTPARYTNPAPHTKRTASIKLVWVDVGVSEPPISCPQHTIPQPTSVILHLCWARQIWLIVAGGQVRCPPQLPLTTTDVSASTNIIDAARIVCDKRLCNGRMSVRPSVCPVDRQQERRSAGLPWAADIHRLLPPVPELSSGQRRSRDPRMRRIDDADM